MKFSICVPTYNRAYTLGDTICSVLRQTFEDFELLIIDDGSTDETEDLVKKYDDGRIKYFKKQNGGKHSALNEGIEKASGEYFMILDSDDLLTENCLETFLREIKDCENADNFVGVIARCEKEDGTLVGEPFGEKKFISYVELHYTSSKNYGDCAEVVKLSELKKYRFPEGDGYKFVPERYVFDRIGLDFRLKCTDEPVKIVYYKDDGITKNSREHMMKNAEGFLIETVDKLTYVFPKVKIPLGKKFRYWVKYWVLYRAVNKREYKIKGNVLLKTVAFFASALYKTDGIQGGKK